MHIPEKNEIFGVQGLATEAHVEPTSLYRTRVTPRLAESLQRRRRNDAPGEKFCPVPEAILALKVGRQAIFPQKAFRKSFVR
jgi:hypothetical protein